MKAAISLLIGLVLSVSISAEPFIEGRVRLESGEPVAAAQVRIFDMTDLQRGAIARAQTDGTGYFALPLAALRGRALPEGFALGPNYPNPFNPSTVIPYQLATASEVRLEVFNLLGQRLATLVDGERLAGFHTATWTATDGAGRAVGAGVYIYRMTVGAASQTGRMLLLDGQAGVSSAGAASAWLGASGGGGSAGEQVYGLIVSGEGLVPYLDSDFRVAAGMAPVELVVSSGSPWAGKATDEVPDDAQVNIPDAKLRAAIAAALGKASGATITKGEMAMLTSLWALEAGIRDLTGLEFATNLTKLTLDFNSITDTDVSRLRGMTKLRALGLSGNNLSDVSPLAGLTKLEWLYLSANNISDISPLRGMTRLRALDLSNNNLSDVSPLAGLTRLLQLYLGGNNISDISPLRGLTRLLQLYLGGNNISDISPLRELTRLGYLYLEGNNISDISPLRELTYLEQLYLRVNPLSVASVNDHITALGRRGVAIRFDPPLRESDFDIEVVFLDHFSEGQKRVIQYAARRWMSIIREDLPDYTFAGSRAPCGTASYLIPGGGRIDHLRPAGDRIDDLRLYVLKGFTGGQGGAPTVIRETSYLPVEGCISVVGNDLDVVLHEIGHVLGIGTIWHDLGFIHNPNADPYFNGPRAIAAFNDAGGRNYSGAKVPVQRDRWGGAHWRFPVLSGELMLGGGLWALSAITIQALADLGYVVDVTQANPYTLPDAAAKPRAKIAAPPAHAKSELSCGTGQRREPIYVIDPQGNIVRTLHR